MDALNEPVALYGQALAELAEERGELAAVARDLEAARQAFALPEMGLFFRNPLLPRRAKLELIDTLFGGRAAGTFILFLKTVVRRRRERLLKKIIESAYFACLFRQGVDVVTVTTSQPLAGEERDLILERLTAWKGSRPHLEFQVDPGLIGGLAIRQGDLLLDGTVLGMLKRISERLAMGPA